MTLHVVALLVLGLMCGSELNVAVFAHPILNRFPLECHVLARSSFAAMFGRVMPFWMPGSTVLTLMLLMPFEHLAGNAWWLAMIAFAIQVVASVGSLLGPVPINNRIIKWTSSSLPQDWKAQEHRWDLYHWVRTAGRIVAFALVALSLAAR
jgi:uncharacterized membrane protein